MLFALQVRGVDFVLGENNNQIRSVCRTSVRAIPRFTTFFRSFSSSDKKKKEIIETRNESDNLIYNTEKQLKEYGKKLDDATKQNIQKALDDLRASTQGDDMEAMKAKLEEAKKQVMSIGEQLYKNKGPEAAAGADASANAGAENKKEDVVDAEFTEKH